jgi:putative ABC transport system substrate-binding protein
MVTFFSIKVPNILKVAIMAAFIIVLLALPAYAERTVGIIMTGDIEYYHRIHKAFIDIVGGLGDVNFIVQVPSPEPMAWTNAARKLVVIGSDVIVTYGAPATLTVMKETSKIPIVFAGVYDPESMNMAGKNATGISSKVPLESLLRRLKEIKAFSNLGVVFNKNEKDTILQVMEIKKLEGAMGFKAKLFDARKKGFSGGISGVDALVLTTSCTAMCEIKDVVSAARANKIPTGSTIAGGENKGIILTLAADPDEQGRTVGEIVLRLFKGHDITSIPVRQPSKVLNIVNLKEAAATGLNVPASVQSSASKVIK